MDAQEQRKRMPPEVPKDTPEYYADAFQVTTNLYGATIFLGELRGEKDKPMPMLTKCKIKVSPQMFKVIGIVLSNIIKDYESKNGVLNLPVALLHDLGIE